MKLTDLENFPLKALPTEVLLSLRDGIRKELGRRGHAGDEPRYVRGGGKFGRPPKKDFQARLGELDVLMAEDWSHLFPNGDEARRFYVYAHVNPRKGRVSKTGGTYKLSLPGVPFYIGKGCGDRAWDLKRNEGHGAQLRQLRGIGVSDSEIVHIVSDGLNEREALEIESKLVFFFGTKFETGRNGILVNLDLPPRPAPEESVPMRADRIEVEYT